MSEDSTAALEWQDYKSSLCSGCGLPRHETFDPNAEGHYNATALTCHACATRDRKAYDQDTSREAGDAPMFGRFYAVERDD